MLPAIAEFEPDFVVERTHDGLAAARGRKGGPKFKMTATKISQARGQCTTRRNKTVQEIADTCGSFPAYDRPSPAGAIRRSGIWPKPMFSSGSVTVELVRDGLGGFTQDRHRFVGEVLVHAGHRPGN